MREATAEIADRGHLHQIAGARGREERGTQGQEVEMSLGIDQGVIVDHLVEPDSHEDHTHLIETIEKQDVLRAEIEDQ